MKKTLPVIFSFFCAITVWGEETDGYYISKNGDTVRGKVDIPVKSKIIRFDKMTFDIRFSKPGEKFKKIDRLDVKGFGFSYEGKNFDFDTWDVKANKQIYLISALGDVAPDGVYFILRTEEGKLPIYSLFQEIDDNIYKSTNPGGTIPTASDYRRVFNGYKVKRDIIFRHPSKGYIYISDKYPPLMKLREILTYLELEQPFINTLSPKNKDLLDIVKKYNEWKSSK